MHHDFIDKYSDLASPIHALDARVKLLFFPLLITACVSTPPNHFVKFALYFSLLSIILIFSRVPAGYVFRKSLVVIPFVLVISAFIPFVKTGGGGGGISIGIGNVQIYQDKILLFWNVLIKAYTGVTAVILLNATTSMPDALKGLRRMKAPVLLIDMLSFFYRYIFVLVDEAQRMKRARDARLYRGRWLYQAKVIGNMAGTLFLRSFERGERTYAAMLARGYEGKTMGDTGKRMPLKGVVFLFLGILLVGIIRFAV